MIALPREKFWVPDIVINEFMDENTAPVVPYLYLFNDGKMHNALPVRVVSSCNLDIYNFPFDIQKCVLSFNSYLLSAAEVKIFLGKSAANITQHSKNVMTTMGEWELLDITAEKYQTHLDESDYNDMLMFSIKLKRRSTTYVVNLLLPSCFLITVDLFSFLLPPQTVDRSTFKMTLILGYTVFLLIMNDLLPITGNTIPLINVFFSLCLALMTASLLETILITYLLCSSDDFSPVPRWVQELVLKRLGRLVCLPQKNPDSDTELSGVMPKSKADDGPPEDRGPATDDKAVEELRSLGRDLQAIRLHVEEQLRGNRSSEEWTQVGVIIDRLLFGLYILILTCCPLKVKPSKLLFIFICVLMHAPCGSVQLNCTQPDLPSLLAALTPVFNLNSIRPVKNFSTPTSVNISFTLFGILGVDEKAQILTTFIWQTITWENEFIRWDPVQCGSEMITVPRTLLWVPDMVINEFMKKNVAPPVPYNYVFYNGTILDEQPVKVVSSCRLDIYTFPFDTQNCTLSFCSYLFRKSAIMIESSTTAQQIFKDSQQVMETVGEWNLIGIELEKFDLPAGDGETYQELRYFVSLKRNPTMYVVNLLIPSCLLITVDLFSFLLPPKTSDRSSFKMTLILGYTVFLLIMNNLLPITGNTIPLINVFLSLCLALMVASLLETILITNLLCGSAQCSPLPSWIRVLVLDVLGRLLLPPPKPRDPDDTILQNPNAQELEVNTLVRVDSEAPKQKGQLNENQALEELRSLHTDLRAIRLQVEQQLGKDQNSDEWVQVGLVIDRLLFGLYILFISVSFITIIVIKLTCKEGYSGPAYESIQAVFDLQSFRPAVNLSNPTIANISFTLYAVLGVNEKTQILTTFLWLRLYWKHEFLVWDPDQCDGVTKISLPVRQLWSPDIIVYEFVDDDVSQACPYVYVNHTGHIRWDRMLRLVSACNLEIFSFPFDVQNCTFTFGSYMHTIKDVRVGPALTFEEMSVNSKRYLEASGEWELVDILGDTSILQFGVVVKRRPVLYVVNLLIPSSFLMLIDILSFYLPPHSVDRASFKMTLILGYTVFLLIMNDLLPSTANGTPIIGIYFSVCLALMVISLLETVIITNVLHHSSMKYREVPKWVRVLVLKHIANIICYHWPEGVKPTSRPQTDKPESSNADSDLCVSVQSSQASAQQPANNGVAAVLPELQQICLYLGDLRAHLTSLQKENELQEQWCHVGYVLDYLLFRTYLLIISCYALVIITMWCIWISQ
ncbi:hypothetical protein Q5P01_015901 [Channa striata]|uniref:5-hydroxytryptamine receptor 3A n=1 Tax=Channa striata TaxID=64152 RepID=A0AA88MFM8_CHASR|nr:hypothetical protein Q5P01_015901 [Channa striata]